MITAPTLATALASAKPGDTLALSGEFPAMRPKIPEGVTLDCRAARMTGLWYPSSTLRRVRIEGGRWAGLRADGVARLEIDGARFEGAGTGYGLFVNGGSEVHVRGLRFAGYRAGIVLNKVAGFEIRGSRFTAMTSDGMTLGECRRGMVSGNRFWGFTPSEGAHPDGVQLYSRPTSPPTADIEIRDNIMAGMMQGIGCFNHVRDGVDDGGFDRLTIRRNVVIGGYPHAIAVVAGRDLVVEDNDVSTWPGARWRASINLVDCAGVIRRRNTVAAGAGKPGADDAV